MEASAALAELVELSTQVVEAIIVASDGSTEPAGTVQAAHAAGDERARALAAAGADLLEAAAGIRAAGGRIERVHVDLKRGSLVVCSDGERSIVATTIAEPTAGLVAYDLRAALRRLREEAA
ncbi:MAG: hypothetical protein H0W16_06270 [Actinobacteria bacterium]|nr:hypothetical protein [Actinomycetota bacterium]